MSIKSWTEVVRLHPDVESEDTPIATYAIDLGAIVEGDPNVPPTYKDPYSFFRATYLTKDMRVLIEEVYYRLSGKEGNRVLQLRSPFGGGKSHTLATLYYALRNRKELEISFPEMKSLPKIENVRIAVFDGEKFDALNGKKVNGNTIQTIWGYIAWQLGEYKLLKEHDQKRVAPGGDLIKRMLGEKPVLIILDEVSRYLEKSMAVKVEDSTLYRQVLDFMQTITTEVSGSKYACMIYSLQASAKEFFGNIEILETLDHLTSRVDAKREPITGDEIFEVLRKRLLAEPPSEDVVHKIADIYIDSLRKNILSHIASTDERLEFEDRIIKYRERFVMAYPFHPALIDLMRERWASIPDFQRTRGALRFLAAVLRELKKRNVHDYLVSATDIPIDDPHVRRIFLSEVGQREPYQAVLEADFIGPNATVEKIDKTFTNLKSPAKKIATAILMFSFGGLPKEEGTLPSGVTEQDLMFASISPNLDSTTIKAILKEILSKCLYVHYDGVRYSFKTIPNVNKILEDEAESVSIEDINKEIKNILEQELAGKSAIIWQDQSKNIPDKEAVFRIVYLPLDFAYKSQSEQERLGIELLTQYGDRPRIYKNGIALAIPERDQIEPLRRAIRYLIAIERVKNKKKSLNLTVEQIDQLKERERTETVSKDSALRNLYGEVWLLKIENGEFALDKVKISGRALQNTNIHERLMELLSGGYTKKIFDYLNPSKLLEFTKEYGTDVKTIIDTFFSSLEFPRVIDDNVIKKAIAKGVKDGLFGLTIKNRVQKVNNEIQIPTKYVSFKKEIEIDEIDVETGYIVNFEKISQLEPSIQPPPTPAPPPPTYTEEKITQVTYSLRVNRQQLFKCFNAIGNLAEKSVEILLKVEAKIEKGIDPVWLRNAVEEPIEEAGVKIEKIEKK